MYQSLACVAVCCLTSVSQIKHARGNLSGSRFEKCLVENDETEAHQKLYITQADLYQDVNEDAIPGGNSECSV